ncbi:hypothetical protein U1Q18_013968, partial [Sarracenia purpurea var. burkii]
CLFTWNLAERERDESQRGAEENIIGEMRVRPAILGRGTREGASGTGATLINRTVRRKIISQGENEATVEQGISLPFKKLRERGLN